VNVGVVGLGYWGPQIVRNLVRLPQCTSVAACDVNESRLKSTLDQYPSVPGTTSYEELLADTSLSAVVIATPVDTHVPLARLALAAGKSVLVEKPLAKSHAEATSLIRTATEAGILVMAGHTFLHSAPVIHVRNLLRSGDLGEPIYVQSSRVNLGIHQSDVSVLWDLAPHDLSILFEWLGEFPVAVSAIARSSVAGREPDVAFVDLEFPSGALANLHLSWLAPTKVRRTTLVASRKMVIYEDTNGEEPVKIFDRGISVSDPKDYGQFQLTYRTGDIIAPLIGTWEPLQHELAHFLDRVSFGETPGEEENVAAQVVLTIEMAEESLLSGGTPMRLADAAA
jgi:predicted dehydrogenase